MENYWDKRYLDEGKIWGEMPSSTAAYALELFQKNNVRKLLVPGSGYGRNTKFFAASGLKVTGIEISLEACRLALAYDTATRVFNISVLEMATLKEKYDAIYCFNVLHLFRAEERKRFISLCIERTKHNCLMFFTVFSEKEPSYGKGAPTEPDTFESKPGRPVHYFTENDLRQHFKDTDIIETGIKEDQENHGEGPHTHLLRYICVKTR